jgi:hypothetical protein
MKKVIIVSLFCLTAVLLNGCGEGNAVTIRTENRLNISKINVGMTKTDVLQIMGNKAARASFGKNAVTVTNPFRTELRTSLLNGQAYEVLYYYTHQEQRDWPFKRFEILERELTPVVLQDGKVIGWGDSFLAQL